MDNKYMSNTQKAILDLLRKADDNILSLYRIKNQLVTLGLLKHIANDDGTTIGCIRRLEQRGYVTIYKAGRNAHTYIRLSPEYIKQELCVGKQIVYVPTHAAGDINHPDAEYGFVTSVLEGSQIAYCRFFLKNDRNTLRTLSNSEATPIENIVVLEHHKQEVIDEYISRYCS